MSNHFEVLSIIACSFTSTRFITDSAGLVSNTKIEISDKLRVFTLSKVGIDMCFSVLWDDEDCDVIDSIISLPHESNSDYAHRICNLIRDYH